MRMERRLRGKEVQKEEEGILKSRVRVNLK
jgi:hypothetical protein